LISINSNTRQFIIPGSDLVFGVEHDSGSVIKQFQCPRYVGNNLDLMSCFIRMNYRNANGEIDSYLVSDVAVDGDTVVFGWELTPKVTMYKGNIGFVMCVVGPDTKVQWHTTLGRGQVLEGLEPDSDVIENGTADVVAQLITMVNEQTENVRAEGSTQIQAVRDAAEAAEAASVAEIEAKGVNTQNSIPADYTALSKAVDGLARSRAGAVVCETAGSVIAVNDASSNPMQGIRIFGRSTQDGTPTPEAPVEIKSVENPVVTVAGKNLLNTAALTSKTEYHGVKAEYQGDGIFRIYGTVTSTQTTAHLTTEFGIPIHPDKNYTFCAEVVEGGITGITRIHPYLGIGAAPGKNMNWLATKIDSSTPVGAIVSNTAKPMTTNAEAKFITRFWIYFAQPTVGDVVDMRIRLWLTQSDAPEAYEPYVGQTVTTDRSLHGIPVTSGGNYTDSDGQQWICDEVDLERGVYVQRVGVYTNDGTTNWGINQKDDTKIIFMTQTPCRPVGAVKQYFNIQDFNWTISLSSRYNSGAVGATGILYCICDINDFPDTNAFVAHLNTTALNCAYVMATPIETALSETEIAAYRAMHTNHPNTTVLNSAGAHMVVKYAADTKLYIDNKIAALIGG
jgi:hypothetical protein